jgi:hypothetical protein
MRREARRRGAAPLRPYRGRWREARGDETRGARREGMRREARRRGAAPLRPYRGQRERNDTRCKRLAVLGEMNDNEPCQLFPIE